MRLKQLFWILFWVALIYAGVKFGYAYYQYFMMKQAVEEAFTEAVVRIVHRGGGIELARQEVMDYLLKQAKELAIELDPKDIKVELDRGLLSISLSWTTDVALWVYTYHLPFWVEKYHPLPSR